MICPACGMSMVEEDFGGTLVDVCKNGCKGIWFDWGELKDLDESHEGVGKALEEALKNPRENDADRGPLKCPKCGIKMREHKYRNAKEVNVDECYACGGFFLDSGELKQIRDNYMSEDERETYVQRLVGETPLREDTQKTTLRAAGCNTLGGLFSKRWPFIWP
ncbi:MAG: zf-TFIIB domain-containing protein [Sedimentisphaerales bacterium]